MVGVYCIHCSATNKKYIGSTTDIETRVRRHYWKSVWEVKTNPLYDDMELYGTEHFVWGLIEEVEEAYLKEREMYWMNHYNTVSEGYNVIHSLVEDKYSRNQSYQRKYYQKKIKSETPEQKESRLKRRRELRRKPHDTLV